MAASRGDVRLGKTSKRADDVPKALHVVRHDEKRVGGVRTGMSLYLRSTPVSSANELRPGNAPIQLTLNSSGFGTSVMVCKPATAQR